MANNQLHGKRYENHIRQAFPKSLEVELSPVSPWDILGEHDHVLSLPTSVKTSKNKTIGMSDARKFVSTDISFRLLVAFYTQGSGVKQFTSLNEFIITPEIMNTLRGELTLQDVIDFHAAITSFGPGRENQKLAQAVAREFKAKLKDKSQYIVLNPKIDSKDQRRLQCSIKLDQLAGLIEPSIFTETYLGVPVFLQVESSPREFNKNKESEIILPIGNQETLNTK